MDVEAPEVQEAEAVALGHKDAGNGHFKEGKWSAALACYTQGIEASPSAVLLSNRAACHLKMESFGAAIADADSAIALDPTYVKGHYRRGGAFFGLGKLKQASLCYKKVVKLRPQDAGARKKLAACTRELKRERFAAAMAYDAESSSNSSSGGGAAGRGAAGRAGVDPATMTVPSSYKGPHLGAAGVTAEFAADLRVAYREEKILAAKYAVAILQQAILVVRAQPSLVDIAIPEGDDGLLTVCGDTHGQFYDLCNIFKTCGEPSATHAYLFNGDFVDRGSFSVENIMYLLVLKLLYPTTFFLSRGNHETKNMNKIYGFEGEVLHKYDVGIMQLFTTLFNELPLAHVIEHKALVVHGGLFQRDGVKLSEIRAIPRGREPPDSGLMSDLLWSDPSPFMGRSPSKRGVGQAFGPDVTSAFLDNNGLQVS